LKLPLKKSNLIIVSELNIEKDKIGRYINITIKIAFFRFKKTLEELLLDLTTVNEGKKTVINGKATMAK
jgi:hypothetical protein